MKMQERMKMRSVSFSDEAPSQAPMLPPRGHRLTGNALFSISSLSLALSDPTFF